MIRMTAVALFTLLAATASADEALPAHIVVVSNDTEADLDKVQKQVKWRIARPNVQWIDDSLPREAAAELQQFPNECTPTLSAQTNERLAALSGEHELYVALPVTKHHKDTVIWRWDKGSQKLQTVLNRRDQSSQFAVSDTPARVIQLPWPNVDNKTIPEKSLALLRRQAPAVEMGQGGYGTPFIDVLMEHPNECVPEMTPEMQALLAADAEASPETDLYVGLRMGGTGGAYLWRWDAEQASLTRILN